MTIQSMYRKSTKSLYVYVMHLGWSTEPCPKWIIPSLRTRKGWLKLVPNRKFTIHWPHLKIAIYTSKQGVLVCVCSCKSVVSLIHWQCYQCSCRVKFLMGLVVMTKVINLKKKKRGQRSLKFALESNQIKSMIYAIRTYM